jgi:hypothetical protein
MMPMLNREDFARAADQEFDLFVGEATIAVTLVGVEPLTTHQGMTREAFSLIFRSASSLVLPQKIYPMRNRSLADAQKVDVFIVPIGRDADGVLYQAVFN